MTRRPDESLDEYGMRLYNEECEEERRLNEEWNKQEELREIENHRYLAAAFYVLPLSSGRIAILGPRRELFQVVETWEEAKVVGPEAARLAIPDFIRLREQPVVRIKL